MRTGRRVNRLAYGLDTCNSRDRILSGPRICTSTDKVLEPAISPQTPAYEVGLEVHL